MRKINIDSDALCLIVWIVWAMSILIIIGVVIGAVIEERSVSKASYCSTCNKIYFDESNRCDECGTEYIKYEDDTKK